MPILEELLNSVGDSNTLSPTLGLCSGFWQVKFSPESRGYTAFSTPSGNFRYCRMPMSSAADEKKNLLYFTPYGNCTANPEEALGSVLSRRRGRPVGGGGEAAP